MKVLILGATGFIGLPAAQALVRAGHMVYGLSRSEAKAKMLAAEEIIPIIGDVESDVWIPLISTLDVIIETVGGDVGGTPDLAKIGNETYERVAKAVPQLRTADAPLLSYIYTSGTWVHGESRTEIVTDTTPISHPAGYIDWRPETEQLVARSAIVNGIVVRPALLYGRSGSIFARLFRAASEGRVVWPGTPGGRYAVIHTDDLADLYVRVAEQAQSLGGKIFDAATPVTESVDDLLAKLVVVSKAKGPYEYKKPETLLQEAITTTTLLRPYLANALLGWSTKKPGVVDGLETYYAAWLASR
ncbi:hypothetical protein B0H15DRAFT_954777 [Mycena belliarum]|uniref:NAD-dependent epimerase/dehydratase domain-containing protein n=1 Tax=Mycena belliarum TaxID=1033014 RepID=A0AAD6TWP7_9AGAR|nr:hypothetical protein B0H15DRAFT_954777 [Mycena belliae]